MRSAQSDQLGQGKGAVAARGDEEVLAAGGGEEPLEAIVLDADVVLVLQVEGGLADAQGTEALGGRDEDGELALRQAASAGDVHRVEAGAVHAEVKGRAGGRAGGAPETGQVPQPARPARSADA